MSPAPGGAATVGGEAGRDRPRTEEVCARLAATFDRYLRTDTYPLAIRLSAPGEPLPEGVRVPSASVGERWIVCQSVGIARRYGWGVAVGQEDVICPLASVAFGLRAPSPEYEAGRAAEGMFCGSGNAAAALEAAAWRLRPGEVERIVVQPLVAARFEPHVIALYGNSAQVMRLVNAALWARGGRLTSTFGGRLDCAELIVQPYLTGEPAVVLPCNGDRVFGMAQDTEMAFSFPFSLASAIAEGLEGTHRGGVRYPIPVAMRRTPDMPPHYSELLATLPAAPRATRPSPDAP